MAYTEFKIAGGSMLIFLLPSLSWTSIRPFFLFSLLLCLQYGQLHHICTKKIQEKKNKCKFECFFSLGRSPIWTLRYKPKGLPHQELVLVHDIELQQDRNHPYGAPVSQYNLCHESMKTLTSTFISNAACFIWGYLIKLGLGGFVITSKLMDLYFPINIKSPKTQSSTQPLPRKCSLCNLFRRNGDFGLPCINKNNWNNIIGIFYVLILILTGNKPPENPIQIC